MQKRIFITGENGYIGTHIKEWLSNIEEPYDVTLLNLRTDEWKNISFKDVDVIIHTAGIVHSPEITDWDIYKKVNVDLTFALAQKAKSEGVNQLIFMSTMAVYGKGKRLSQNIIDEKTEICPTGFYGKSKYIAEQKILPLQSENFKVVIVRPPNVYGKNCKGGYITGFKSVALKLPALPYAYPKIKQSTLYIDNLCELVRLIIENGETGLFMPQDKMAVSAVELLTAIIESMGKKISKSRLLGLGIYLLSFLPTVKKAYGGVAYSEKMTAYYDNRYVVVDFKEGIRRTLK